MIAPVADRLVIATRRCPLALWQAEDVRQRLVARFPALRVELLRVTTGGDGSSDSPRIGALEEALLDGRADIAVHAITDLPAALSNGLEVGVMLARGNPRDAFVSNRYDSPADLMQGARIGTCSPRRRTQLLARRPDLDVRPQSGDVGTRLRQLDDGHYDAIVLAAIDLVRLDLQDRIRAEFPIEDSLPAAGQGIVGIQSRTGDERVRRHLAVLHDPSAAARCRAERGLSARLGDSGRAPIGAYSVIRRGQVWLRGLVANLDGSHVLRAQAIASPANARALGVRVAEDLLAQGAELILGDLGLVPQIVDASSTPFTEPGALPADASAAARAAGAIGVARVEAVPERRSA